MKAISSRPLLNTWTNFVRACFTSVALLSCFFLPCSANAEDVEDVIPFVTVDDLDEEQFRALAALAPVALGATSSGNITNDVASILAILNGLKIARSSNDWPTYKIATAPLPYNTQSTSLGATFNRLFTDSTGSATLPAATSSYLYQIQRALYGQSGVPSSSAAIQPILSRILDKMNAATNSWTLTEFDILFGEIQALYELLDGTAYDINNAGRSLEVLEGTVFTNAYAVDGTGPTISVHDALLDDHLSSLYDMIQGALGSVDYNLEGVTDSLTSNEVARAAAMNATYSVGQVDDHAEDCYDYTDTDDTISTNDLDELEIAPGDTGDLSPVLDLVDADSVDVLPSLTGGDPVVQVFTASRDSNLPAFSIDFSLPFGFQTFIHAVAVWIWRILFFVAMWRLVSEEYSYWSTLGGAG